MGSLAPGDLAPGDLAVFAVQRWSKNLLRTGPWPHRDQVHCLKAATEVREGGATDATAGAVHEDRNRIATGHRVYGRAVVPSCVI